MTPSLQEMVVKIANKVLLGFDLMDRHGADRHGAWEWTWRRTDRRGWRLMVAVAAAETDKTGRFYDFEVWAGAEAGFRFGRVRVGEVPRVPADESQSPTFYELLQLVEAARGRAETFGENEMSSVYDNYRTFERPRPG